MNSTPSSLFCQPQNLNPSAPNSSSLFNLINPSPEDSSAVSSLFYSGQRKPIQHEPIQHEPIQNKPIQNAPAPGNSLFLSSSTSSNPNFSFSSAPSNLFGGSPDPSTVPPAQNLFSSNTDPNTLNKDTGSSKAVSLVPTENVINSAPTSSPFASSGTSSGGIFGKNTDNTSGSLFSSNNATNNSSGVFATIPNCTSGSLFSSNNVNSNSGGLFTNNTSGSLFSSNNVNSNSGGLFSGNTNNSTGSLFSSGGNTNNNPGSLFGARSNINTTGSFGSTQNLNLAGNTGSNYPPSAPSSGFGSNAPSSSNIFGGTSGSGFSFGNSGNSNTGTPLFNECSRPSFTPSNPPPAGNLFSTNSGPSNSAPNLFGQAGGFNSSSSLFNNPPAFNNTQTKSLFNGLSNTPSSLFPANQYSGMIPLFKDYPKPGNKFPMRITLTYKEEEPNIKLILNKFDTIYFSDTITTLESKLFKYKDKDQSKNITTAHLEIEFPEAVYEILLWIYYKNNEKLLKNVNSINSLLELYAASKLFSIKDHHKLRGILLSAYNGFSNTTFSSVFNKKYIDLEFMIELFKQSCTFTFGTGGNYNSLLKTSMALEWLGERDCENDQEIEELINSDEFKIIGERLRIEKILPTWVNDYALLARRYPIAIQAIGIQQVLLGLNLL